MSIEKSQLKAAVLHSVGVKAEDMKESAVAAMNQAVGKVEFGKLILDSLRNLMPHIQKDLEEDPPRCTPEEAAVRRKQLQTAINCVTNLCEGQAGALMQAKGRIQEAEAFMKMIQKDCEAEVAKVKAIRDGIVNGTIALEADGTLQAAPGVSGSARPAGVRPAGSLKQRRLAEAAAEEAEKQKAESKEQDAPQPAAPKRKTRGKKKASSKSSNGVSKRAVTRSARGTH